MASEQPGVRKKQSRNPPREELRHPVLYRHQDCIPNPKLLQNCEKRNLSVLKINQAVECLGKPPKDQESKESDNQKNKTKPSNSKDKNDGKTDKSLPKPKVNPQQPNSVSGNSEELSKARKRRLRKRRLLVSLAPPPNTNPDPPVENSPQQTNSVSRPLPRSSGVVPPVSASSASKPSEQPRTSIKELRKRLDKSGSRNKSIKSKTLVEPTAQSKADIIKTLEEKTLNSLLQTLVPLANTSPKKEKPPAVPLFSFPEKRLNSSDTKVDKDGVFYFGETKHQLEKLTSVFNKSSTSLIQEKSDSAQNTGFNRNCFSVNTPINFENLVPSFNFSSISNDRLSTFVPAKQNLYNTEPVLQSNKVESKRIFPVGPSECQTKDNIFNSPVLKDPSLFPIQVLSPAKPAVIAPLGSLSNTLGFCETKTDIQENIAKVTENIQNSYCFSTLLEMESKHSQKNNLTKNIKIGSQQNSLDSINADVQKHLLDSIKADSQKNSLGSITTDSQTKSLDSVKTDSLKDSLGSIKTDCQKNSLESVKTDSQQNSVDSIITDSQKDSLGSIKTDCQKNSLESVKSSSQNSSLEGVQSNPIMKSAGEANRSKTREEVMLEREAKKAAKLAAKAKHKTSKPVNSNDPNTLKCTVVAQAVPEVAKPETGDCKVNTEASLPCQKSETKAHTNIVPSIDKPTVSSLNELKSDKPATSPAIASEQDSSTKSKSELRAERRAKQEAQRAAKSLSKTEQPKPSKVKEKVVVPKVNNEQVKTDQSTGKIEKKPEAAKTTSQPKPKLFSHLFQEKSKLTTDNILKARGLHPAVVRLGVQYSSRAVVGSNARCVALLHVIKQVVNEYTTPSEKEFSRGLEEELGSITVFLNKCRPLSVSMTNALRHIKRTLTQLPNNIPDVEARRKICDVVDIYVQEQIDKAGEAICETVNKKIANGDVILTYGCSSLVYKILVESHLSGTKFRVVVVDGLPWGEGREMVRRLVDKGLSCTYVLITAASFIMREASKVLLGAHALLANGYVMSRAGSSQVALLAHCYNVPVLVCCETHKFCERVQTDAFVYNELGGICYDNVKDKERGRVLANLTQLSLAYDITPPDLVSAVVTELAVLPCTSVPVILRIKPAESVM